MMQVLVPNPQSNVMHFLYVPLPDLSCPLTALAPLHGFKLLQPVAGRPQVDRLLQIVPNVFRTVAAKKCFAVSVSKPLCQGIQIEGVI
jgi:hypothetical protein